MKKLTTTVFAAMIALALSMPAMAQGGSTAPAKSSTTQSKDKDDTKKPAKKTAKKKAPKKTDADKNAAPAKK